MSQSVQLGICLLPERMTVAYCLDGRLYSCPPVPFGSALRKREWHQLANQGHDYFAPRDLIGVETPNPVHAAAVAAEIKSVVLEVQKQDLTVRSLGIVVPTAFEEFQRRHLLHQLHLLNLPARLIDASVAALRSISMDAPAGAREEETVAVVIAEDSALEIALARMGPDEGRLLGTEICPGLSGRSLNHFLLKRAFASLADGKAGKVAMSWDALNGLLDRLNSSHSRLARMPEIQFPLQDRHLKDTVITLRHDDIQAFFALHAADLAQAVERLRKEVSAGQGAIARVILLGELGEFSEFTQQLEKQLGSVEILPGTTLADGAALAPGEPPTGPLVQDTPGLVPLHQFLKEHAQPLALPVSELSAADLERQITAFFDQLKLAAATTPGPVLEPAVTGIKLRAEEWLKKLQPQPATAVTPDPHPPTGAGQQVNVPETADPLTLASPAPSRRSQRYLEDAHRMLAKGRVLDAVSYSHQAYQAAPEDHATLLAMLEIHRQGAAALAGPENFEAALIQLNCALQHRRQDKQTQQALAERYVEQAHYLQSHGRLDEALELLDKALDYVEDDAPIQALHDQWTSEQAK